MVNVFKNRPGKVCGRQTLKSFTWSILEYLYPNDMIILDKITAYFS